MTTFRCIGLGALGAVLVLLPSCASALKKRCESTNWHEYGESIAKRGERVTFDTFVQECEKEDAKIDHAGLSNGFAKGLEEYCTADFAYHLGRQGEFLPSEMCAGNAAEREMHTRHAQGVREYCQPGNGVQAGVAGKKYNQICPKEMEAAFLPGFNEGRKKFLTGVIIQRQGEERDLDQEISRLELQRSEHTMMINQLEASRAMSFAYDPKTNPEGAAMAAQNNQRIDQDVRNRRWELDRLGSEIAGKQDRLNKIRGELRQAQGELPTL